MALGCFQKMAFTFKDEMKILHPRCIQNLDGDQGCVSEKELIQYKAPGWQGRKFLDETGFI